MAKISVIVFSLTREELDPLVNRLKNQTYQDFEIVSEYGGRIVDCINRALERAKGEIIVFTETDCLHPPDWLENIALSYEGGIVFAGEIVERKNFSNTVMSKEIAVSIPLDRNLILANDTAWFQDFQGKVPLEFKQISPVVHQKSIARKLSRGAIYARDRARMDIKYKSETYRNFYDIRVRAYTLAQQVYKQTKELLS
jgi:glycosyltransferase involved in cell wall biosynthesis